MTSDGFLQAAAEDRGVVTKLETGPAGAARGRRAQAEGARLKGALFRSQTYGREEIGLDRAAVTRDRRRPISNLAVGEPGKAVAEAQRQTGGAEAAHLLDAFR